MKRFFLALSSLMFLLSTASAFSAPEIPANQPAPASTTALLLRPQGDVQFRTKYDYPYTNAYLATLTARLLKPSLVAPQMMMVPGLPGREKVPLIEDRNEAEAALFIQPKKAPLVFLIPGIGGTALDGAALYLGEKLYLHGFSTIVLPSPMAWKFVLSQSTTGIPGFTPEDARDLRRMMIQVKSIATKQYGLKAGRLAVAGYSLGAIDSAFIMKLEREDPQLGLERAVMINPPLHIPAALKQLDTLDAVGDQWTRDRRDLLWGRVWDIGRAAIARDINDPKYFLGLDRLLPFSTEEIQYLIGNSFRQTLADALFTSQQVNDIGLFKTKATEYDRTARQNEVAAMNFADYSVKGALPFWNKRLKKTWTLDEFVAQGNILTIKELIFSDKAFRLLHNQDDFLSRREDLDAFSDGMGERAVIYPLGGHVGNLWMKANQDDFIATLKDLL